MLDCDRGLVLNVTEARKYAPSVGPVLTVKSVRGSQVRPVQQGPSASLSERAAAPNTEGVKLPKSADKKLRVISEPEKLRDESRPKKLYDISLIPL